MATTGSTSAAFSDYVRIDGNVARAGTVVVGGPTTAAPALEFLGLVPSDPITDDLPITYSGTIQADLYLDVDEGALTPFCDREASDGALQIQVAEAGELEEAGWVYYCSLLGSAEVLELQTDVAPESELDLKVHLRLAPGADSRYSGLDDTHGLTVMARQSDGGRSFADHVVGTIQITTGHFLDQACVDASLNIDTANVIRLTAGDDVIDLSTKKKVEQLVSDGVISPEARTEKAFAVLGLGGDDVIIGTNKGDCLMGGDGNDSLLGANGKDVLVGGAGSDLLWGGNSGRGETLVGGDDDDILLAGNGPEHVDGGAGDLDVCDGNNGPLLTFDNCERAFDQEALTTEQRNLLERSAHPPSSGIDWREPGGAVGAAAGDLATSGLRQPATVPAGDETAAEETATGPAQPPIVAAPSDEEPDATAPAPNSLPPAPPVDPPPADQAPLEGTDQSSPQEAAAPEHD